MGKLAIRDVDLSTLPKYPSEPFSADDLIAFLQGQLRHQRMYFDSDKHFFESVMESALEKGEKYAISATTINKILYDWRPGRGLTFSVHTLECIWKGLS